MLRIALCVSFLLLLVGPGCRCQPKNGDKAAGENSQSPDASPADVTYDVLKEGSGAEVADGSTVTVHYVGTLAGGRKFDSSVDRNIPYTFKVGAGEVIPGWDKGVKGMRVGEKRRFTIPPSLAYGEKGAGTTIPPNATLILEIEVLSVK